MDREHPCHERVALRPWVNKILRSVAKKYGVSAKPIEGRAVGKRTRRGKVEMYLLKELCDLTLQEIAQQFGRGSYGVVG